MNEKEAQKLPKYKPSPIFDGLPDHVKDPKNYIKIEKKLFKAIKSTHNHEEVVDWAECKRCQKKFIKRRQMMKEYGFTSHQQYLMWKKIMDIIVNKKKIEVKQDDKNIVKGI